MRKYNTLSKVFYLIAILNFVLFIALSITNIVNIEEYVLIIAIIISCTFIYVGGCIIFKKKENDKILKINMYIFFCLYMILFIFFLFINPIFGRGNISFETNLIPFKTIKMYIRQFNSLYEIKQTLNLIGNFICVMPFAFFIKQFFKKKHLLALFLILLFVFGIEFMQYFTKSGAFDVDDIILNGSGAIIMYFILCIKVVDNIVQSIFYKTRKITRNEIISLTIIFLILIGAFIAVFQYRKHLYNKRYNEYEEIVMPKIDFIYSDKCSENNLFYEDEIYKYYFECYDASQFYVLVNGKDKLDITTLIDGSKYNVDIDKIIWMFKYKLIKYYTEHKYQFFDLEIEQKTNNHPSVARYFQNEYARLVLKEKDSLQSNTFLYEINIVPYKRGSSTIKLDFDFYDDENNIEKVNKYIQVNIDENLITTYKIID